MKKNRILSLFVTLTMIMGLLAAFPIVSHAMQTSGRSGGTVWEFDPMSGSLYIKPSGSGKMDDGYLGDEDLEYCTKDIMFEDGVTYVGAHAFERYQRINKVFFADSITEIGNYAFCGDTFGSRIQLLALPENLEKIGDHAFDKNYNLFEVRFRGKLKTIGDFAFRDCWRLVERKLPPSVQSIGVEAFAIENQFLGEEAYRTAVGVQSAKDNVIYSDNIPRRAFYHAQAFKTLEIGEGCTEIGEKAFAETDGITKLILPKSIKKIDRAAFENTWIGKVCYKGTYEDWQKIDLINDDGANDSLFKVKVWDEHYWHAHWEDRPIRFIESGSLDLGLEWELKDDGTLVIRKQEGGDGTMENMDVPEIVYWYGNRLDITSVIIEDGVKTIGDYAFYGCKNLRSVTIPSSVTKIGKYAFKNCISLQNLTIPDSVTEIGDGAFMNCYFHCDLTISGSLNSIGNNAFSGVTITGDTKYNGSKINWDSNVDIEPGNKSILSNLLIFDRDPGGVCPKTESDHVAWSVHGDTLLITGAGKMKDFDSASDVYWLAYRDNIKKIRIDDEVTSIGKYAFAYCGNLEEVDIMGNITEIGRGAFEHCTSLKNIYLPASVAVMASSNASQNGKYVFNDCTALESIDMDVYNTTFRQWDGGLYDADLTRIIQYPLGKLQEDFTLRDGVETITSRAFSGAVHLKTVTIPQSVTSIEQWAFDRCNNLTDIYYEGTAYDWVNVTNYDDKVTALYNSGHVHFAELPEDNYCGENVTYELVGGTLNINGTGAMYDYDSFTDTPWYFDKSYIDEVVIGSGVTHIGDYAFYGCDYLGDVTIPDSVTSIGDYAFAKCPYLGTVDFPHYLESIGDYAFWDDTDIMSITIPNTCESLGESAFRGCSSLMTATLPSSLEKVSWALFCDCSELSSITIPAGVTEIENNAFNGCVALETVTLPDTVETIGNGAFYGCDNLRYVYYAGSYGDRQNNVKTGAKTRKVNDANWSYGVTHSLTLVPAVEPTCSAAGHVAYYECSHCDKIFEDSEAVTETSLANVAIPHKEHNLAYRYAKAATCTDEGCIEHYECIYCHQTFADEDGLTPIYDVTTPTVAHDIEWMQPTDATCTGDGYDAHYECTVCHKFFTGPEGFTEDDPDIHITAPATGHDWEFTEWLWADDCSFCYGIFTCRNDEEHITYVDAEISEGHDYNDDGNEIVRYTAEINNVYGNYTDTKERVVSYFGLLESADSRLVDYSIFLESGELWINGAVSQQEPVYVGFYDERGKLSDLRLFTAETEEANEISVNPDIATIKVMWWKAGSLQPICENAVLDLR